MRLDRRVMRGVPTASPSGRDDLGCTNPEFGIRAMRWCCYIALAKAFDHDQLMEVELIVGVLDFLTLHDRARGSACSQLWFNGLRRGLSVDRYTSVIDGGSAVLSSCCPKATRNEYQGCCLSEMLSEATYLVQNRSN